MLDKFVRFPVNDVPGFVGFMLLVVASMVVAKRLPGVKQFV